MKNVRYGKGIAGIVSLLRKDNVEMEWFKLLSFTSFLFQWERLQWHS